MKRIALVAVVGVILLAVCWMFWGRSATESNGGSSRVSSVPVRCGDLGLFVRTGGAIVWDQQVVVRSVIPGRLDELRVGEGQRVRKGDTVAIVSPLNRVMLLDAEQAAGGDSNKWADAYLPVPVFAPAAGVVTGLPMKPGNMLTVEAVLMVISDTPVVRVFVEESDITRVSVGSTGSVRIDALPDCVFTGTVSRIGTQAVIRRNAVSFEVDLAPGPLPPSARVGMSVAVEFAGLQRRGVLLVPRDAVLGRNGQSVVRCPGAAGAVEERPIRVGVADGESVEVLEGLREGDMVLVGMAAPETTARGAAKGTPLLPFTRGQGQ